MKLHWNTLYSSSSSECVLRYKMILVQVSFCKLPPVSVTFLRPRQSPLSPELFPAGRLPARLQSLQVEEQQQPERLHSPSCVRRKYLLTTISTKESPENCGSEAPAQQVPWDGSFSTTPPQAMLVAKIHGRESHGVPHILLEWHLGKVRRVLTWQSKGM